MPYPPTTRFPSAWADDTGVVVDRILRAENKYHGKTIALAAEMLSQDDTLAAWTNRIVPQTFPRHWTILTMYRLRDKSYFPAGFSGRASQTDVRQYARPPGSCCDRAFREPLLRGENVRR
jgi:hypothetical protein